MKAPKERWYLARPFSLPFRHSFAINLANRREKNISGVEWHDRDRPRLEKKRDLSQIPDSSRVALLSNHANGERGERGGELGKRPLLEK